MEPMVVEGTDLIELWEMGAKLKERMTAKLDKLGDGSLVKCWTGRLSKVQI